MSDPVAWKVIERGWKVVAADGTELGTVHEVVGDSTADIFNGLAVSPGVLKQSRYVPSERVSEIVEGRVRLDVAAHEVDALAPYEGVPQSAELDSFTTDLPPDAPPAR